MKVLEPSAGTGNIAVLARMAGGDVDTNEIDERRIRLLILQGFGPTAFDAERLDNLLWPGRLYDTVVMNPPFSATGGRVKGHSTHFGARHVEQALLRLKPGGRLVAIVGRGMALDRPTFRTWWSP
jgi:tRNA G10  N-methylase Trm11